MVPHIAGDIITNRYDKEISLLCIANVLCDLMQPQSVKSTLLNLFWKYFSFHPRLLKKTKLAPFFSGFPSLDYLMKCAVQTSKSDLESEFGILTHAGSSFQGQFPGDNRILIIVVHSPKSLYLFLFRWRCIGSEREWKRSTDRKRERERAFTQPSPHTLMHCTWIELERALKSSGRSILP